MKSQKCKFNLISSIQGSIPKRPKCELNNSTISEHKMSREDRLRKWSLRLTFLTLVWIYILLIPYTKVEESFNLQAIRDILKLGLRFQDYDHQQFPGVVPRTFLAAIATSFFSFPAFFIATNILLLTDLIGLFIARMTIVSAGMYMSLIFCVWNRASLLR